jgi:hypothetical protein
MECSEYLQLSQRYGAALRRWAQAELSLKKSDLPETIRRLGQEIERKALEEKNAAYVRMTLHQQSCRTCNEKPK